MSQRDTAAVDVNLVQRGAEGALNGERLCRERLVYLKQVDVLHGPAGPLQLTTGVRGEGQTGELEMASKRRQTLEFQISKDIVECCNTEAMNLSMNLRPAMCL